MGFDLGGFLGGFQAKQGEYRKEAERQAADERDRNSKILTTLAGSDDPEVRNMAVTAMLSGAAEGKPGKGLSGFFGEIRQHPLFKTLSGLVNTPVRGEQEVKLAPGGAPGSGGAPLPGSQLTASGALASRPAAMGQPLPPSADVGAPPPGTSVDHLSYPTSRPRQLFLSEGERAEQAASGTIRGRITGGVGAYQTLTGNTMPPADVEDVTRGAMGSPRRVMQNKPGTLKLKDGTTVAGSFDPETDTYVDASGKPRADVTAFIPGNPNAGEHQPAPRYATDAKGVLRRIDPDGTVTVIADGAAIGKPQQPPGLFTGLVPTPSGIYGVDRGGQAHELAIPKGVDPQVYATQLQTQMTQIRANAEAMTQKFSGFNDPDSLAVQLDIAARSQGFGSWAELQAKYAAAVRAVGTGVPAAGAPPPAPVHPGRGTAPAPTAGPKVNPRDPLSILVGPGRGGR